MLDEEELRKNLIAAGHKIVDDTLSKEELHYYDTHHFGRSTKEERNEDSAIVVSGSWEKTVAKIRARREARKRENAAKVVTIRIPLRVIEGYKEIAASEGVGYQTLMNEVLETALA